METFGKRLKYVRRQQDVKQKMLAAELNIAISTLSQYENDKRHPNFSLLVKIANFFDVSTDYLLGTNENKNSIDISKNIKKIDTSYESTHSYHVEGDAKLSYNDLIHKITNNLLKISDNNDYKSLEILHNLYSSISSISVDYNEDNKNHIEDILTTHLNYKENIDQTLNKLFRHHIKINSKIN